MPPPPPPRRSLSQDRDEASLLIPRRRLVGSSTSSRSPMRAGSINGGGSRPHTLPTPPPQHLSNNNTSSSSSLAFSPTVRNRANPFITNNLSSSSSNPILRPPRGSSSQPHPPPPPTTSSSFELTSPPTAPAPRNLGGRTMSSSSSRPPPSPFDFGASSSSSSASPSSPFARRLRNSVTLSRSDMDLDELSGPWTTSSAMANSASSPLPPSSSYHQQQQQQQRAPFNIPPFVHTRETGSSSRHRFGGSGGAEADDEDYYINDDERMASSHVAGGGEDRGVTSIFGINARRNSSSSSFAGRRLPPPSTSIAERGGGGGGSRRPQSGASFSSGIPRVGVQRGREDDSDVVIVLDSDEEEQRGYGGDMDPMDGYDATTASFLNRLSSTTSDGGRRGVSHSSDNRAHLRRVEDARRDVRRLMGEQRDQLSHLRRLREEARERREDLSRTLTAEATLQRSIDDHHRRLPSNIQTISSGDDEDDDDDAPPRDTCPSFWFTGSCPDEGRCPFLHTLGRNALSLQRAATNRRERLQASQRRMDRTPLFPSSSSSSSSLAAPSTGLSMPISTDRADSLLALSTRLSMLRERVEEVFPAPGGVIIRTGYSESNGPLSGLVGSLLQFLETAGDQAVMASLLSSITQGGGASVSRGVPEDQLHKLETFQCPTAKGGVGASSSSSPSSQFPSSSMFNSDIAPDTSSEANGCSICLCDLSDKPDGSPTTMSAPSSSSAPDTAVMLARMPNCKHVFHEACLTMWLKSSTTCPLCRGEFSLVEAVASPST